MTLPTTTDRRPTPARPTCEHADAVRRVVDPDVDATWRCGRCGVQFPGRTTR